MQTRIAVRDKDPHHFQVYPLRELAHSPLPAEQSAETRPSKSSHPLSSLSGRLYSVHEDASGDAKKTRSLGRTSGKLVLQRKDTNIAIPELKHKKTASLEVDFTHGPAVNQQGLNPSTLSHGYSQPFGQYSFRLKPWKSWVHHSSPNRSACDDNTTRTVEVYNQPIIEAGDNLSAATLGLGILPPTNSQSSDFRRQDLHAGVDLSQSFSTTLNDSDAESEALPKISEQDSKKRHAIYSHLGILPLGRDGFLTETQTLPGLLSFDELPLPDSEKSSNKRLQQTVTQEHPFPADNLVPFAPTGVTLPPTLPLKVARTSMTKLEHLNLNNLSDEIVYPEKILNLIREIDDSIKSWKYSIDN